MATTKPPATTAVGTSAAPPPVVTSKTSVVASTVIKTTTVAVRTTTVAPSTSIATKTTQSIAHTSTGAISPLNTGASDTNGGGGGMSGGAIAGMVVGVILLLVGSVVGGFLLLKQRRKRMMLVGRNARSYNGYPEPDISRPPMASFRQEGRRPTSGYGGSMHDNGYGGLSPNPALRESGVYDDKSYHAAAAGLGGARAAARANNYTNSMVGGPRDSYAPIGNGRFVATGRRDGEMSPNRATFVGGAEGAATRSDEGDRTSDELDLQQLERERELDLQQQARLMGLANGDPVLILPSAPTSPLGPYPQNRAPMPGSSLQHRASSVSHHNMPPHFQNSGPYYGQPHQMQYDPRAGPYYSQPIPTGGYSPYAPSGNSPMRPQSQYYPPQQYQQQYEQYYPAYNYPPGQVPSFKMMRPISIAGYQPPPPLAGAPIPSLPLASYESGKEDHNEPEGKTEHLSESTGDKQEFGEAQQQQQNHQHAATSMSNLSHVSESESAATSTAFTATNDIRSKDGTEPMPHSVSDGGQLQQVNAISEALPPSTVADVAEMDGVALSDKQESSESTQSHPSVVEPTGDAVSDATPAKTPPPLPLLTKPTH